MNSAPNFLNKEHQLLSNFLFFRSHNFCIQLQALNIFFQIALNFDEFYRVDKKFHRNRSISTTI